MIICTHYSLGFKSSFVMLVDVIWQTQEDDGTSFCSLISQLLLVPLTAVSFWTDKGFGIGRHQMVPCWLCSFCCGQFEFALMGESSCPRTLTLWSLMFSSLLFNTCVKPLDKLIGWLGICYDQPADGTRFYISALGPQVMLSVARSKIWRLFSLKIVSGETDVDSVLPGPNGCDSSLGLQFLEFCLAGAPGTSHNLTYES